MKTKPNCPRCKRPNLTIADFNKNRSGIQAYCKQCSSARRKIYYRKNRKKIALRHKKFREENSEYYCDKRRLYKRVLRLEVLRHYSRSDKPFCDCCKKKILEFLTLDHKNGGGNKFRRENPNHRGEKIYAWVRRNGYPDGFRVLCQDCNHSYGAYGYCPHKVGSRYLDVFKKFKPKVSSVWKETKALRA